MTFSPVIYVSSKGKSKFVNLQISFGNQGFYLLFLLDAHSSLKCNSLDKKTANNQESHWLYDPKVIYYRLK